jgi:O-antigen/teichoic acid export membrane protein
VGIIIRQSVKSTVVTYGGVLLGVLNTLVLFPHFLQPDQFGLTRVLLSVAALIAQLAEFGGGNVIVKYFPIFREEKETFRRFVFWILLKALGAFAVISFGIYFFKQPLLANYEEKSNLVPHFFGYIFPLAIFLLIFNLLEAYARSLLRITIPTLLREVYLRIFLLVIILLYHFGYIDFEQFIFWFAASYCSAMLIIAGYVFWLDRVLIKPSLAFAKHEMAKEIFVYGIFSILTSGVWRAVSQLDIIMLGKMDTLEHVAAYFIGFSIVTLIQLPQRFLHLISEPIIAKFIQQEDWQPVKELYQRVALNQFIIGNFLFLGIWVNMENFYNFLPAHYHNITWVVFVLMMGRLIDMGTGFNGEVIHYSKFYKFNLIAGIVLATSCVAGNLLLIPQFSMLGAAYATFIAFTIFNTMRTAFVFFKFGFLPFSVGMAKAIVIGLATLAVAMVIPDIQNVYVNIVVKSAVVTILFPGLVYALRVSEDINDFFWKVLRRVKAFKL